MARRITSHDESLQTETTSRDGKIFLRSVYWLQKLSWVIVRTDMNTPNRPSPRLSRRMILLLCIGLGGSVANRCLHNISDILSSKRLENKLSFRSFIKTGKRFSFEFDDSLWECVSRRRRRLCSQQTFECSKHFRTINSTQLSFFRLFNATLVYKLNNTLWIRNETIKHIKTRFNESFRRCPWIRASG